jgi:GxxExxY protein
VNGDQYGGGLVRRTSGPRDPGRFSGINLITERIIGAAIEVHRTLGPGLLESAYRTCLAAELEHLAMPFQREVAVPLLYRGLQLDCSYRLDFLVDGRVVVEVKAVTALDPIFTAQALTYLKLTGHPLALLINFNVPVLKQGIRRLVL